MHLPRKMYFLGTFVFSSARAKYLVQGFFVSSRALSSSELQVLNCTFTASMVLWVCSGLVRAASAALPINLTSEVIHSDISVVSLGSWIGIYNYDQRALNTSSLCISLCFPIGESCGQVIGLQRVTLGVTVDV